jgi:hypothetical protein
MFVSCATAPPDAATATHAANPTDAATRTLTMDVATMHRIDRTNPSGRQQKTSNPTAEPVVTVPGCLGQRDCGNVRVLEVFPFEQERLAADLGDAIREAVAVVQSRAMLSLAVLPVGGACGIRLVGVHGN